MKSVSSKIHSSDENFRICEKKREELYKTCLLDVASGGQQLRTGTFQIYFANGKLGVSHKFFGESTEGEMVYSVTLKKQAAFQKFKQNEADEIDQEMINAMSLYFACAIADNRKLG